MTDLEINKALALAIGWVEADMHPVPKYADLATTRIWTDDGHCRLFDYRDWRVAGPIAAKFDCFPEKDVYDQWVAGEYPYAIGDTPQKAIAMAVIGAAK